VHINTHIRVCAHTSHISSPSDTFAKIRLMTYRPTLLSPCSSLRYTPRPCGAQHARAPRNVKGDSGSHQTTGEAVEIRCQSARAQRGVRRGTPHRGGRHGRRKARFLCRAGHRFLWQEMLLCWEVTVITLAEWLPWRSSLLMYPLVTQSRSANHARLPARIYTNECHRVLCACPHIHE
jgi:hypothetical protein